MTRVLAKMPVVTGDSQTTLGDSGPPLDERSLHLRRLIVEALASAGKGHVGPSMSLVEILRVLYDDYLHFRPTEPLWPERDRLVLSKGHGCLALYAILADKGYFSPELLTGFCKYGSALGGHPERGRIPGIEASTGSLGHGLPIAVGMALAARIRRSSHRVVVVVGDGELDEGSMWEAVLTAAAHGLSNLLVFVDYNKMQCHGPLSEVLPLGSLIAKFRSFGWAATEVDGHDVHALRRVVARLPLKGDRPSVILCHTVKGRGISMAEHSAEWHYRFEITADEAEAMFLQVGGHPKGASNARS